MFEIFLNSSIFEHRCEWEFSSFPKIYNTHSYCLISIIILELFSCYGGILKQYRKQVPSDRFTYREATGSVMG